MKKIAILIVLLLTFTGCVSSAVSDAIDSADQKMRLKWQEEWKPQLIAEAKGLAGEAQEAAVAAAVIQLDKYKLESEGKLERIGVKVEEFDANKDGQISGVETLALVKEIKAKNDKSGDPLGWWEILLAVGGAYLPLTGVKELAKKKMSGTGDGQPV
tara:strand:+ start:41477 stop:41947 length:471 start_codon:yes stop_codon:yes gene_type:complete